MRAVTDRHEAACGSLGSALPLNVWCLSKEALAGQPLETLGVEGL